MPPPTTHDTPGTPVASGAADASKNKDIPPAHSLWVELATRITTQRLHFRAGDEETAAESVFKIFAIVRGLMEKHPEAKVFEALALRLLNDTLRPFTARWHGWMCEDRELRGPDGRPLLKFKDAWVRRQFRRELLELQPRVRGFQEALAQLMNGRLPDPELMKNPLSTEMAEEMRYKVDGRERRKPGEAPYKDKVPLGMDLVAGIPPKQVRMQLPLVSAGWLVNKWRKLSGTEKTLVAENQAKAAKFAEMLNQCEHADLQARRKTLGLHKTETKDGRLLNACGLALSGGGIRSATFCLGIVQVLARRRLLLDFDYLSTVSGGGYLGAFLSSYLGTGDPEAPGTSADLEAEARLKETFNVPDKPAQGVNPEGGAAAAPGAALPADALPVATPDYEAHAIPPAKHEPRALRHLRNRSRYLMDGEFWNRLTNICMVLAGGLLNLLIVLPVPLVGALVSYYLYQTRALKGGPENSTPWLTDWLVPADAPWCIWLWRVLGALACLLLVYPLIKRCSIRELRRRQTTHLLDAWNFIFKCTLVPACVLLAGWIMPAGFHVYHACGTSHAMQWLRGWAEGLSGDAVLTGLGTLGTLVLTLFASRHPRKARSMVWLMNLGLLVGPLLYLLIYLGVGYRMIFLPKQVARSANTAVAVAAAPATPAPAASQAKPATASATVPAPAAKAEPLCCCGVLPHEATPAPAAPEKLGTPWPWQNVAWVTAALLGWAWLIVDVNTYSPHGYYRDRLCDCYLQSRKGIARGTDPDPDRTTVPCPSPRLLLTELGQFEAAPYHLINATLNLPSSKELELRGRNGDFFLFSKHYCGSPLAGYHPTGDLEAADPHMDLGTAMAISGAAASSNMGWKSINSLRLVMTLANVRLGYWLRHPALGVAKAASLLRPGPACLMREMFAAGMDEKQKYLNLSDGGHIENLAVYELLRRQCKFIVCVDGGQEPGMECTDLIRLERYASIDLGIKMHYDLSDLALQPNGWSRAYGVLVKIDYDPPASEALRMGRPPTEAQWGWMLYLKLAMVGYGPGYVMDYHRQHPAFPHQSTGDQLYDEAQFEAYRALGEAAAESFFVPEITGGEEVDNLADWFTALATQLLPDNDEAFRKEGREP